MRLSIILLIGGIGLLPAAEYSWQQTHAAVDPSGDIHWQPQPLHFSPGSSIKYIDYDQGSDDGDGSRAAPWQHHPWDPAASGQAAAGEGVQTYVFKKGVVYRGALRADDAGSSEEPIQLTVDPTWGHGQAWMYGSERITDWKPVDEASDPGLGSRAHVWYADIPFLTRCVWHIAGERIYRMDLSRTPNWRVTNEDDVKSEWLRWEDVRNGNPGWGKLPEFMTRDPDFYKGATVWSTFVPVMSTPYPTPVVDFKAETGEIAFKGFFGKNTRSSIGDRFYLENIARYLDTGNEYWFDQAGEGGRLYVRLHGDADPNETVIEAGRHLNLVDLPNGQHIHVSGLGFRFTNTFWNMHARHFTSPDVDCAVVRGLGAMRDVQVRGCRFEHVNKAVRFQASSDDQVLDRLVIADNEIRHTDHGAILAADSSRWGKSQPPFAELRDLKILRNRLHRIGFRPIRSGHGHAIRVNFPDTAEIAGNILTRCYGAGLFIFGGKGSGQRRDKPLGRILIHHNKVVDPLLNTNDWGGIETWQGGNFYVYGNIVDNPGGYWYVTTRHKAIVPPDERRGHTAARFGHAYYLDGAFKNFHFNNIAIGKTADPSSPLQASSAFQEIHSFQNSFFNNTAYRFGAGSRRQAPHAGRNLFLGNAFLDISDIVFKHGEGGVREANAADAGKEQGHFALSTNAYGRNVFWKVRSKLATFEPGGAYYNDINAFRAAAGRQGTLANDIGVLAERQPLQSPADGDFTPHAESPAVDGGVRVFVPWGLKATVGEWHFRRNNADPAHLIDEHWYMTPYYAGRTMYWTTPRYPMQVHNVGPSSFEAGSLDDWCPSALRLNGRDQYAVLSEELIEQPFELGKGDRKQVVAGAEKQTPELATSDYLVEAVLQVDQPGVLLSKRDDKAGVEIRIRADGVVICELSANGAVQVTATSAPVLCFGDWQHLVLEIDRAAADIRCYLQGKPVATTLTGTVPGVEVDLDNTGDLLVGGGPGLQHLQGSLDFLRIARSTLASSRTSIDELYTWQFDGPQYRDFSGQVVQGERRDAGAVEYRP